MTLIKLPNLDNLPTLPHETINGFCAITYSGSDWRAHILGGAVIGVTMDFLELAEQRLVYTDNVDLLHICGIILKPIGIDKDAPEGDVLIYQVIGMEVHGATAPPPAA